MAGTWLNILNRCQPGWCGTFGIPFTYRKWSDEIAELNGRVVNPPYFSPVLLVINVLVVLAVAWAVWLLLARLTVQRGAA
jgi:hypothetical protein